MEQVVVACAAAVFVLSGCALFLQACWHGTLLWAPRRGWKPEPEDATDRPRVLVQLPLFNEPAVVDRLLDAVMGLDWPAEMLVVQILNDSTDDTPERVERWLAQHRPAFQVDHIRRADRAGFKAGALQAGLDRVPDVPWVMVYDADFVPGMGDLAYAFRWVQADTAAVQLRWDHLNAGANGLTRAQALNLDAHFAVEQQGREVLGVWNAFNGTAGLWRTEAIRAAGGWQSDTLAEDLDLSVRVQLAGWRIRYVDGWGVPAELPADFGAYRAQQRRWTQGGAACARKHLRSTGRLGPRRLRWHARAMLCASSIHLPIWAMAAASVGLTWGAVREVPGADRALDAGVVMGLLLVSFATVYKTAANRRHPWRPPGALARPGLRDWARGWRWFLPRMFALWLLGAGMAWWHVRAWWAGWRGVPADFVRTPKRGSEPGPASLPGAVARGPFPWAEWLHAVVFVAAAALGVSAGRWGLVPFHLLLAGGYAWVATGVRASGSTV